ncbi:MAG TPA: DUF3772 domain-containing protein, partial [Hyphomicrobiaceae bacterium]|nr:DUF3772 domain-containing protein [Hyphomicrobiaceae bacterium]
MTDRARRAFRTLLAAVSALIVVATAVVAQSPPTPPGPAAPPAAQPAPAPIPSKPQLPSEVADTIDRLAAVMDSVEKSVAKLTDAEQDLGRLRDDVERIITQSTETADKLRPRLSALRSQIERLGPLPGKDAPAEAAAITAERARLTAEATNLDGAIKTLELTWVRARQMIDKITDLRLTLFTKSLMERMSSPLLPSLWRSVMNDFPPLSWLIGYVARDWWSWAQRRIVPLSGVLGGAALLYLALRWLAAWLVRKWDRAADAPAFTFFERAADAAWVAILRALPGMAAALAIYVGLDLLDLLYYPTDRIGGAVLKAVLLFVGISALIRALFAPRSPHRRLLPIDDQAASRVCRLLQTMAGVTALDTSLTAVGRALYAPLSISVAQSFLMSMLFAALLIGLLLTPFVPRGSPPDVAQTWPKSHPRWLKGPLWLVALAIIAASVLGYLALGRFVTQQLMVTGVLIVVATLLYLAIRAFTRESETAMPVNAVLEGRFGLDPPRRQQIVKLVELALTLTLVILALPILLLQWGFSGADIRDWLKSAIFGFEIGQFKISLARILIGVVLFTALLFATRLFQRWMRESVLVTPRVDPGIAHSIDTAIGYVGIAVSAIIAVSYAGFDITSLAIVAGALSVGIGFGLQSIVNNFVSGLILLIERPIKVGAWIVVGDQQGNVRRISVSSTEIETFDRASLIVPNSELITGRVLNWTHRNQLGRLIVKITVGSTADPEKVLAVLRDCAGKHARVLGTPEPRASFDNFGANGLDFSVRMVLDDVNRSLEVQTDLRTAILKRFREEGIEIP